MIEMNNNSVNIKHRILLVTQYFHPEVGATQTRMYEFAKNLSASGHDVTVLCEFPNHPHGVIPQEYKGKYFERDRGEGFDILRVWVKASPVKNFRTRIWFYFSFMIMAILGSFKLRGKWDAVLATSPPLPVAVSGWVISVFKRAKFIMDIRDIWPEAAVALGELSNPKMILLAEKVECFLYRRSALVPTVTKGFIDHIQKRCGDPSKVCLIPNGTITEIFNPDRRDPELRARLELEDKFICTFAGTMGIAQGLPFILDLAKDLQDHPDIVFLLIGTGPVRAQLEEKIAAEQINNVRLLDQVPLAEITPYLNISDVLFVPLKNDPVFDTFIPSKMFDFLACKKPIILGVDGEARSMLESRGGGLFARPEDAASYRDAILKLKNDPQFRQETADRGYGWVTAEYTRKTQTEQLEQHICQCLGEAIDG